MSSVTTSRKRRTVVWALLIGMLLPMLAPAAAEAEPIADGYCVATVPETCADEVAGGLVYLIERPDAVGFVVEAFLSGTGLDEDPIWVRQLDLHSEAVAMKASVEAEAERIYNAYHNNTQNNFPDAGDATDDARYQQAVRDTGARFYDVGGDFNGLFTIQPPAAERIDLTEPFSIEMTVTVDTPGTGGDGPGKIGQTLFGILDAAGHNTEGHFRYQFDVVGGKLYYEWAEIGVASHRTLIANVWPAGQSHVVIQSGGAGFDLWLNGLFVGNFSLGSAIPEGRSWLQSFGVLDPLGSIPATQRWLTGAITHIAMYDFALSGSVVAEHAALSAATTPPEVFNPTLTYPVDWGSLDDPIPNEVPEVAPAPEVEPPPEISDDTSWLGGIIGGAVSWLGGAIVDALHWIGDLIAKGFAHLYELVAWMTLSLVHALQDLYDGLVVVLVNLQHVLVETLGILQRALVRMLAVIWQAILDLPGLIAQLVIGDPADLNTSTLTVSCVGSFPCSWIVDAVAGAAAIGDGINGGVEGSCAPPSIGYSEFSIDLPGPAGCRGAGSGNATADNAAGDLFGYRQLLRLAFSFMLWAGFVSKMLAWAPWSSGENDSPLAAVA
jgi:hypothetical protein